MTDKALERALPFMPVATPEEFRREFSMPNRFTFEMDPVKRFLKRHIAGPVVVDPFSGRSTIATHRNDLLDGVDARDYLDLLIAQKLMADTVLLDPPYSPRQITECYKSIGRECSTEDTQNSRLYAACVERLDRILMPGGMALRFGWNSMGFPKQRYERVETLLVNHGAAHNDTICTADRKIRNIT